VEPSKKEEEVNDFAEEEETDGLPPGFEEENKRIPAVGAKRKVGEPGTAISFGVIKDKAPAQRLVEGDVNANSRSAKGSKATAGDALKPSPPVKKKKKN
jgi:hypothetical protein